MTVREFIHRIWQKFENGTPSDDARLRQRRVYSVLLSARAFVLEKVRLTDFNYTTLSCVPIERTTAHECGCVPINNCSYYKTTCELPSTLGNTGFKDVTTSTGPQAAIGSPSTAVPVEDARPYKVYSAILVQDSASDPVVTILENTLDRTITCARNTTGTCTGTFSSSIGSSTKNFIQITGSNNATFTTYRSFNCGIGTTTASIYSRSNETTLVDGWKGFVEIRVYN